MELPLTPKVAEVRRKLQAVLDSTLHDQPPPFTATESCALCEQVGVWPVPMDADSRLQALALYAVRAIPALNGHVPEHAADDEDFVHNYERWLQVLEGADRAGARAGSVLLGFWSRADSKRLGPCIG